MLANTLYFINVPISLGYCEPIKLNLKFMNLARCRAEYKINGHLARKSHTSFLLSPWITEVLIRFTTGNQVWGFALLECFVSSKQTDRLQLQV